MYDRVLMPTPALELSGFTKYYESKPAALDLSFAVEPGTVTGLLGPNGAGKSTTIKAVAGIIQPTRGGIRICGVDLATDPVAAKRHLAYVPDEPRLFDELTVNEHLRFFGAAYGVADLPARAQPLLERFELLPHVTKLGSELSRGMRQKVAVCCAYLHDPSLILLDEPLTGLDPRGIRTMKDSIIDRARQGAAVVLSSHLLDVVEDVCSQVVIIHLGTLKYAGPLTAARETLGLTTESSLEDVFLKVTDDSRHSQTQTI
jgi:ABC-2 type transport system ATP-binding protein